MSLDKSNMPLSAKQVSIMDANGKFNYEHIIQRGLVWERSRKSALIESMILGYPIPQVYCRRDREEGSSAKRNSTYVVMDGKQRLTSIASFIRDEWALSVLKPVTYSCYDGEERTEDISGKFFSELPEEIQDKIKDTSLNFIYFDEILPSEERELFKRLNSGKPLSAKAKLVANCKDLDNVMNLGNHPLFKEILTDNARAQKSQVAIVMKMWAMLNIDIDEVSFESKVFNQLAETTTISQEQYLTLYNVMALMQDAYNCLLNNDGYKGNALAKKTAKKFATETHLVSFAPFFYRAIKDGYNSARMMADWLIDFFVEEDEKEVSGYYLACSSGSAKNDKIQARNNVISASYNQFTEAA